MVFEHDIFLMRTTQHNVLVAAKYIFLDMAIVQGALGSNMKAEGRMKGAPEAQMSCDLIFLAGPGWLKGRQGFTFH